MYMTFTHQLSILPDSTRIYPGHDYIDNNLRFTLDREPDNEAAQQILQKTEMQDLDKALISTLGLEKEINTFFRLQNPTVIARLRDKFDELPEQVDARTVFLKLRELRNTW
jgi:hydroxyacylglutathione hydrolase